MAKYGSGDVGFILVDGYDITGLITSFDDSVTEVTEETTGMGDNWREHTPVNLSEATFNLEGFYDDETNATSDALAEQQGATRIINYSVEGNVIGQKAIGLSGPVQSNIARPPSIGALHKIRAAFQVSGIVEENTIILHELSAEDADGDTESTSVDGGAQSTAGGVGYLQVPALTLGGYDDVTIKVTDSADDMTYADLVTFTDIDAAPGVERIALASNATVERYLAADWAYNGSGSDPSVTFMVAFQRN